MICGFTALKAQKRPKFFIAKPKSLHFAFTFHRSLFLTDLFFEKNQIPFDAEEIYRFQDYSVLPLHIRHYNESRFIFKRVRFENKVLTYPSYFSLFSTSRIYFNKRLSLSWGTQFDFTTANINTVDFQGVTYFDPLQYVRENYAIAAKGISDISLVPGLGYNLYMYKNHPFTIFFRFNYRVFHRDINEDRNDLADKIPSPYLKYTIGFRAKPW